MITSNYKMCLKNMNSPHIRQKYSIFIIFFSIIWHLTLTFDLDLDTWDVNISGFIRYTRVSSLVVLFMQGEKLHPFIYHFDSLLWAMTLTFDLDIDIWGVKIYSTIRYTCNPKMESLNIFIEKWWPFLNIFLKIFLWVVNSKVKVTGVKETIS